MAELTKNEARMLYEINNTNLTEFLKTKFNLKELQEKTIDQITFDKKFINMLKNCDEWWFMDDKNHLSAIPTSHLQLNNHGFWYFNIQFTGENKHFLVSHFAKVDIRETFELTDDEILNFIMNYIKKHLELDVKPTFQVW